jgi:hypothetical protein
VTNPMTKFTVIDTKIEKNRVFTEGRFLKPTARVQAALPKPTFKPLEASDTPASQIRFSAPSKPLNNVFLAGQNGLQLLEFHPVRSSLP